MADDFMNGFLAGQGDNNRSGLFGGDGWWAIIIFALIFGWGNGGYGFGGGNSGGVVDGYVLTSDFANIERKIDAVNNGVCDGFYAMNTGMLNGFAGVTQGRDERILCGGACPMQSAGGAHAAAQRHADAEPELLLRESAGYRTGSL